MLTDGILFEREGPIARLTLDRPHVGNAIDMRMARALLEAAVACDQDASIRSVLVTGSGRLFCAGGDIAAFADAGAGLPSFLSEITGYLHNAMLRMLRMDKPLLTAINGPAAGAGLGIALIGDIVLAAPTAHFATGYTAIGLSPDGGATWLLPRLVGLRRAQELCLRNTRIAANEAVQMGLVTRLVTDAALFGEAVALAHELAGGATSAMGTTRRLLLESLSNSIDTQMESESRNIANLGKTTDAREGIAAFLEKRRPSFGRGG